MKLKALAAGGILLAVAVGGATPASAEAITFDGSASAAGFRMVLSMDKAPVTKTPFDVGGPMAQANLDSVGTSNALASFPYPGDLFLAAPGVARGAFGFPAPDYPFVARAADPFTPEASSSYGFADLKANAAARKAGAIAISGPAGSAAFSAAKSTSTASVDAADDRVVSAASSVVDGLTAGPLHLGTLRSVARTVLGPDGGIQRFSEVTLDGATVASRPVTLGPDGRLQAAGSAPAPGGDAAPFDALAAAGLEVTQLAHEDLPDGVVSAGLRITRRGDFGPGGPGAFSIIVGQSVARARGVGTVAAEAGTVSGRDGESASPTVTPAEPVTTPGAPTPSPVSSIPAAGTGGVSNPAPAGVPVGAEIPLAALTASLSPVAGGSAVVEEVAAVEATGAVAGASPDSTGAARGAAIPVRSVRTISSERFGAGPLFGAMAAGLAACIGFTAAIRLATRKASS